MFADELLTMGKASSPQFFARLVVDLLVAMGYGGSDKDAGRAIGRSGDEGIDGIIHEDRPGLGIVCFQAKRWGDSNVGRKEVRAFSGSLAAYRTRKGVFITTSDFTKEAREYVNRIEQKIVSINGERLAELMIDHNIGVTVSRKYEIKKADSDDFVDSDS